MGTFRHHPDGWIFIGGVPIPLTEFMIEEPGYALPGNAVGRRYDGFKDTIYTAEHANEFDSEEDIVLDGYIDKLATYQANIQARKDAMADSDYANSLATAKITRKTLAKAEAVKRFRAYEGTDLELTATQLKTYRTDLIAEKTTIITEIDALTTIKDVREYNYSNWPARPKGKK